MEVAQADALSRILADMESRLATKEDMAGLTWRMIAIVALVNTIFATAIAVLTGVGA